MKNGEFMISGINSSELNSLIQERPVIPSPVRKVRFQQVPGVSGDYIFDEEAYENVRFSLKFFTKGDTEEEINDLKEKITATFETADYSDLYVYSDPENMYEVMVTGGPDFTPNGSTPLLLPYTVSFTAKPFKRHLNSDFYESSGSLKVFNHTLYQSEPLIKLIGTGDMTLHVNGEEFPFQSIDEHVLIDSKTENAYKEEANGIVSRNHRMYALDFPVLEKGENNLSVSGAATGFTVEPRWIKKI